MSAHALPNGDAASAPTYYELLAISPSLLDDSKHPERLLKQAKRRALLKHHPDHKKIKGDEVFTKRPKPGDPSDPFSIESIISAYVHLSNSGLRSSYDKELALSRAQVTGGGADYQTGVETVDLDDLAHDEAKEVWYRGCRCGNERGYAFGEADLEEVADQGELLVGCLDCSLWLRVHFAVLEGEDG